MSIGGNKLKSQIWFELCRNFEGEGWIFGEICERNISICHLLALILSQGSICLEEKKIKEKI